MGRSGPRWRLRPRGLALTTTDDSFDDLASDDSAGSADGLLDSFAEDSGPADGRSEDRLRRAALRREGRDVIEEGAPREGVDIIRAVENAVIVALQLPGDTDAIVQANLDELQALVETAGGQVVERVIQKRDHPDTATFIGGGKVTEIKELVKAVGADAVIFDDDLAPAQQRNLEEKIKQKVLDRTIVILDIFAQHATSAEGRAQVELAQLTYLLPRLRGWGTALSRQAGGRVAGGGGMGGRGPGETQLEVDRRKIMRRSAKLRRDLVEYERIRRTKSARRERTGLPAATIVGYTNAGKSSLLNRLTGADVLVENQLFATLDTTVRRLSIHDGRDVLLSDTVGFVRKLPHGLVEAFKSTLEESTRADLLVHVVDASHPEAEAQVLAVREVLEEIGADKLPEQLVLNKADAADHAGTEALARRLGDHFGHEPIIVSAHTGQGIDRLIEALADRLPGARMVIAARVPVARADLIAAAHANGDVTREEWGNEFVDLEAKVDKDTVLALREWLLVDPFEVAPEWWEPLATT